MTDGETVRPPDPDDSDEGRETLVDLEIDQTNVIEKVGKDEKMNVYDGNERLIASVYRNPDGNWHERSFMLEGANGQKLLLQVPCGYIPFGKKGSGYFEIKIGEKGAIYPRRVNDGSNISYKVEKREDEIATLLQQFECGGEGMIEGMLEGRLICASTFRGEKHKIVNEDNAGFNNANGRFAIADGLGRPPFGHVMSSNAVEKFLTAAGIFEDVIKSAYNSSVLLLNYYEGRGEEDIPSTTLVAGELKGDRLKIFSIGDSKWFLLRNGEIHRRSREQSAGQAQLDEGEINLKTFFGGNVRTQITHSIHHYEEGAGIEEFDVKSGDTLVLISDGGDDILDERIEAINVDGDWILMDDLISKLQSLTPQKAVSYMEDIVSSWNSVGKKIKIKAEKEPCLVKANADDISIMLIQF